MTFLFSEECVRYANAQVTQSADDLSYFEKLSNSEYNAIKNCIDNPRRILDLGCGLGRMSVFLNSKLKNKAKYFLADSSQEVEKVKYGWNPKPAFYNDLSLTKTFCEMNNLSNFQIIDLKYGNLLDLKDIDLVMSFMSVGFHYPIEDYLEDLLKITSSDCIMIFGIRENKYTEDEFKTFFNSVEIQNNEIGVKEKLLILKEKNIEN